MKTPEMEQYEDSLLNSKGDPTGEQRENAQTTDSTPEKEKHREETKRAVHAKEGSKTKNKVSSSGVHRGFNGHRPRSVESETARKQAKKGKLGMIGGLALGAGAIADYSSRIKDGDTPLEAAAGTAAMAGLAYLVSPGLLIGGMVAKEAAEGAFSIGESALNKTREFNRLGTLGPFAANRFIETRDTFTMRQAAMAAIGQSRGNLENAMIGNEAGMFHR